MLSNVIKRFYSDDLDQEEKEIIDNLARLSKVEDFESRYDYESTIDKTFGAGTSDHFDRKDIDTMLQIAKENLPAEMGDTFGEIADDVKEHALDISKDLHMANLAISTSMAVQEMTDVSVNPVVLAEPWNLSTTAYNVAEIIGDELAKDAESEDGDEEDDYGFDDDGEDYDY